jgi:hypothetical protein
MDTDTFPEEPAWLFPDGVRNVIHRVKRRFSIPEMNEVISKTYDGGSILPHLLQLPDVRRIPSSANIHQAGIAAGSCRVGGYAALGD